MSKLRIDIIDNMEDWQKIRKAWNELLGKSTSDCFFLTWEWLFSWAECFLCNRKSLFIIVVYESNEIVAIAPWHIRNIKVRFLGIRQIEFLGTPEAGSDYLDVFVKKGREKEITSLIYEFLLEAAAPSWDRLRLHDIPSNSIFLMHLLNLIREGGKYAAIKEASFCPVSILPKTEEDFFAGLSSNRRQQFARRFRNLEKQGDVKHVTFEPKNLDSALKEFFVLYEGKTEWKGNELHRLVRKFMDKGSSLASIQIDFLSTPKGYVAGLLHFRYRNTLSMYLMSIDKNYNPKISIGNVLVGLCIRNAIRSGLSSYDFLKGVEEYKFQWANFGRRSSSLLFSQRKPGAVILTLSDLVRSAAKLIMR